MRRFTLALLFLCLPSTCLAYEASMLNLRVPSNLKNGQMEFFLHHRFYGAIDEDPLDTFFGMSDTFFGMSSGANVGFGLRGPVWRELEVRGGYITDFSEWLLGLSYTWLFPDALLRTQLDIELYSFREFVDADRENNLFYLVDLETEPLFERLIFALNVGYDGFNKRGGLGFGAKVDVLRSVSILGEYFPVIGRDDDGEESPLGQENAFAFGVEFRTWGHQFMLLMGNSVEIGTRRLMLGTHSNEVRLGFNLQRRLYL